MKFSQFFLSNHLGPGNSEPSTSLSLLFEFLEHPRIVGLGGYAAVQAYLSKRDGANVAGNRPRDFKAAHGDERRDIVLHS